MARGKSKSNGRAKKTHASPKKQRERKPRVAKTAEQMSDDQRRGLLFSYKRRLKPLLEQEKEAKAAVSKLFEQAKREGVTKIELKIALALETDEGGEKVNAEIERIARVARWMNVPVGAQLDMFGGDKRTQAEKHFDEGKVAALDDLPAKPPAHLGQAAAQHWLEGHAEGRKSLNEERASGFKPLGESVPEVVSDLIPPAVNGGSGQPAAH
ncbi:MAG: hypothetical protein IT537_08510 [Hyphomicrobiales bacterium]|nr:hypothetical protein [Hyphomicrobiales bacterium]